MYLFIYKLILKHGCIKVKNLLLKILIKCVLLNILFIKNIEKMHDGFHNSIKQHSCFKQ